MLSPKIIGYILVLVIAVSLFVGGFYLGGQHVKTKEQQTVIKQQVRQNKEVEKIQQAQVKRQIVYVDRLKVVHDAQDSCLSQPMPADVVRALRAGS